MTHWSVVATSCYGGAILLLLLIFTSLEYESTISSKKDWLSRVWKRRGIYSPVLVHIYDTSTDIGVIIIWGQLAFKEKNSDDPDDDIPPIDMTD